MAITLTTSWQEIGHDSFGDNFTIKLEGKYSSQSVANNETTIQLRLRTTGGNNWMGATASAGFTGTYTDSKNISGIRFYNGNTVYDIEKTVAHNSDGTKTIVVGGYVNSSHTSNDASISNQVVKLPTINRYPKIASAPNFNDDENPTMTWTKYSSNFWQRAKMEVGGNYSFIVRDVGKTATSCTFTLTNEERDRLIDAAGDNETLPVRFTICAMSQEHGTEADELSASYLDRTMTVTPKGRIGKSGQWKRVQIYIGKSGAWKRCTPYIGKDGQWKRVR